MTDKPSIRNAVLIAPLGVPLANILWIAWDLVSTMGLSGLRGLPAVVLVLFLLGLPVSYVAMLLFGLPGALLLRSRGLLTWPHVCTGAAVLGAVLWAGFWQLSYQAPLLTRTVPAGAFIGLVVGVIFSLVAKLPRRGPGARG